MVQKSKWILLAKIKVLILESSTEALAQDVFPFPPLGPGLPTCPSASVSKGSHARQKAWLSQAFLTVLSISSVLRSPLLLLRTPVVIPDSHREARLVSLSQEQQARKLNSAYKPDPLSIHVNKTWPHAGSIALLPKQLRISSRAGLVRRLALCPCRTGQATWSPMDIGFCGVWMCLPLK